MSKATGARLRRVTIPGDPSREGRPRVWGYTTQTIAELAGVTPGAVCKAIKAGLFDPAQLLEVAAWVRSRRAKASARETREAIAEAKLEAVKRRKRIAEAVKPADFI